MTGIVAVGIVFGFTARYGPADPSGLSLNIFKMGADGKSLKQLTDTPFWDQFALWIR